MSSEIGKSFYCIRVIFIRDLPFVPVQLPPLKTSDAAMRGALCDPVTLGFLASLAFTMLMLIGVLVIGDSPVMGSRRERMGSAIYEVGALGMNMVGCFILCPLMTVRV